MTDLEPVDIPFGIQLSGPDIAEDARMLMALGSVVRQASMLDQMLRMLYCALVGSKYATITASGQMTNWLLDDSRALATAHRDLTDDQRTHIVAILDRARKASQQRNRFVHDVWAVSDAGPQLMRSHKRKHDLTTSAPVALNDLIDTARELGSCSAALMQWIYEALGPDAASAEAQLRWLDALAAMPPEEIEALARRRQGISGDEG